MVDYQGILGPVSGQVTLNGSGYGFLRFAPAGEQWSVTAISVAATTAVNEATVTVYKDYIGKPYRLSGTYAGSSGDNNDLSSPIPVVDGQPIYIEWTGGDAGAIATATISGYKTVVNRGFRAVS